MLKLRRQSLRRRYGRSAKGYPQRELSGATITDVFDALAGPSDVEATITLKHVISREDVEHTLATWQEAVSMQQGRKIRFTHWREFTPQGHFRYVVVNRSIDAVAIIEEGTYAATAIANRARWALRGGGA